MVETDENGGKDGDYGRYLVLATPQEVEKLLSAFGENAVLIRLTGFRGKEAARRADEE